MSRQYYPEERLQLIYEKVKELGKINVDDITEDFNVSKSTARGDLAELASRGLIKRTHGGAISIFPEDNQADEEVKIIKNNVKIDERITTNIREKDAIGKLAASLVNDGDTIMIDGGSTTLFVAKHLDVNINTTVITNSYYIMEHLLNYKNATVYLAGGLLYKENAVMIGDFANDFIKNFRPEKVIIGIDGISNEYGLTVADSDVPAVATIKRRMLDAGVKKIIVCDHTKFDKVCLLPIAPVKGVDCIVTDSKVPKEKIDELKALGIEVLIAELD